VFHSVSSTDITGGRILTFVTVSNDWMLQRQVVKHDDGRVYMRAKRRLLTP